MNELDIDRLLAKQQKLAGLRPLTSGEIDRLREHFIVENTYNSNAIEGSTLTLGETALVLKGITIDAKPLKEHLEAVGHRDAFVYVLALVQNKVPISEKIIKEIHSLVLMNKAQDKGVYRKVPVIIAGAAHTPPQPYLIMPQMEELIRKYEAMQGASVFERAALFHLLFEGIHPFIDGNGRTGRLLINLDLLQNGYLPISVKFTDRKRYYECFASYDKDGSSNALQTLIGEYEEAELDRYIAMLES